MRLMLKFVIPVEKGNQAAADGSMMQVIQELKIQEFQKNDPGGNV
ncbi:hypothetical protein PsalMR5_01595 [Piscirickettsia salmonis]|nr:hypothetical protein [Piscirickettsia salmonis]QGP54154.1 hypothetical protein PsalSR1_01586 [Piscirickettsia salmonis]QGP59950.1 hypothetical protein PsalBI1_02547 [Piscirickettsia salmonis]QGP63731.1 hypothetical protein PsalMR5_01595 [Piscirickettsia salmonis]